MRRRDTRPRLRTSDIIPHSLRLKDSADDMDELPELVVSELNQEEIIALHIKHDDAIKTTEAIERDTAEDEVIDESAVT